MVKVIQPKRLNKNITVESYWQIRQKSLKTIKKSLPVAYRQHQVQNRHRYLKPTQQAKQFNPLQYFYKQISNPSTTQQNQYQSHFKQSQYSYVNQYLASVRYRVASALIPMKKYAFGLKSICYNHQQILNVLLNHLECDDSWLLIQAMIKDTKEQSYNYWLTEGLQKLTGKCNNNNNNNNNNHENKQIDQQNNNKNKANKYTTIYQHNFNQTKFTYLFDTLAIFLQVNYNKIMQNLSQFFNLMNINFFHHQNKYIRKFSMKSISYIINNLSLDDNLYLIFNILLEKQSDINNNDINIAHLLLNRHKAVKGCLSSAEISKVVETLKQVPLFFKKNFNIEQQKQDNNDNNDKNQVNFNRQINQKIDNILISYISGILDMLQTKYGRAQQSQSSQQVIFDLNYCIKAFISVQQQPQSALKPITLLKSFCQYLQNCDQKKFLTHNSKHQSYINQTFKLILTYLQSSSIKLFLQQSQQQQILSSNIISALLALLFVKSPKQTTKVLISKGIINYCQKAKLDEAFKLVEKIYQAELEILEKVEIKNLGEFLFLAYSRYIKEYFIKQDRSQSQQSQQSIRLAQLLYYLHQILKRINFTNSLNLLYIKLTTQTLLKRAQSITKIHDYIIFSRLIIILNFNISNNNKKQHQLFIYNFKRIFTNLFKKFIQPFSSSLSTLLSQSNNHEQEQNQLFNYNNHIKNLLKYSHHQVEWVSLAFHLESCYKDVIQHINKNYNGMEIQSDIKQQNKQSEINQQNKQQSMWSQLSLNRIIKLDQQLSLQQILSNHICHLQSRNRQARYSILSHILQLYQQKHSQSLSTQQQQQQQQQQNNIIQRIIQHLLFIDSQQIGIDNQRQIKRRFGLLQHEIIKLKPLINQYHKYIIEILTHWILGFIFTGFKLINQNVILLTSKLIDTYSIISSYIITPFIQYYIYRHSRQFQYDLTQNQHFILKTPTKILKQFNQIKNIQKFYLLIKQDFKVQDQKTIEWIGLERIGQAINNAKKYKNNHLDIKNKLTIILDSYFNQQFNRKYNILSKYSYDQYEQQIIPNDKLILQPKTRFLIIMLKLCPNSYLPPYECLHYISQQYLCLPHVHQIKQHRWQALWVKKLKGNKTRQQISQTVNTSIQLQKMSLSQQQMYIHFLFKQIIQSNQHKRRVILQHIRDRVSSIISYLFSNILYKTCLFIGQLQQFFNLFIEEQIRLIKIRLLLQNKKTLLNLMYILKAMITVFKNYLRNNIEEMTKVVTVIRAIIEIVYVNDNKKSNNYKKQQEIQIEQQQQEQQQQLLQQQQIQQLQQQQVQLQQPKYKSSSKYIAYKPHRKQLYKLLTELFTHYHLQYQHAHGLLHQLETTYLSSSSLNNKNNITTSSETNRFHKVAYASVNSVPGLLVLLRVISEDRFYHKLLVKFGILQLLSNVIDITEKQQKQQLINQQYKQIVNNINNQQENRQRISNKKQSNPHAIKQCLDILANIFSIQIQAQSKLSSSNNNNNNNNNNNRMQIQQQQPQQHQQQNSYQSLTSLYLLTHHNKSLQSLLLSINHYFTLSHNLSQTHNPSNINQLQYTSHNNKQNINTIHNNINLTHNKSKQVHFIQENKNVQILWEIVVRVVKLKSKKYQNLYVQIGLNWERLFWNQLNKYTKIKHFKDKNIFKLYKIIQISLIYFKRQLQSNNNHNNHINNNNNNQINNNNNNNHIVNNNNKRSIYQFLCKIIQTLPHITSLSQRIKLTQLIQVHLSSFKQTFNLISLQSIQLVSHLNSVKKSGLNLQINYQQFFSSISEYSSYQNKQKQQLNLISQQFIVYNLLPYLTSEELSIRKAVKQALNSFLIQINNKLHKDNNNKMEILKVYNNVLRLLIEQLKRNQIDSVFWSILVSIGLFIRFYVKNQNQFISNVDNQQIYAKMLKPLVKITINNNNNNDQNNNITFDSQNQNDFFYLICSISQGNKMKALKMLKQLCIRLKQQGNNQHFKSQQKNFCLPHPVPFLLPILQHLILPIKHFNNQHQYNVQGNLSSTLTLISLQIYQHIVPFSRQSLIKKQLKRLSTKIKFNSHQKINDDNLKKNILVIKIISSIVEGIDGLEKCINKIKGYVKQYGFDQFHQKLIGNARKMNNQEDDQQSDNDNDIQNNKKDKKKIQFGQNLQQLEEEQAINRNFMMFDRKMMQMEQQQQQNQQQQQQNNSSASLIKFLKIHILIPFKLMLFYQNKSSKQAKQQQDKSRMMLSVAITKLLIKFPMDMFLFQFQKVLSKICRLLKKRKQQIRQNGRKSLCQIAKIVGPQMLYAIVLQLKFHLRDNFQKHIFNFTVYQIIQSLSPLTQGDIDYCLPLILPMIIDQMFGQSSQQKKMVQSGQIPVLNMQTKKKKGHQLLILLSKQISADKIKYMIDYLQKFLKEYLNSEANLTKYQMMIGYLINGLGGNQEFLKAENANMFGQMLYKSMYQLRKDIKIYNFYQEKNKIVHQTTIKINTNKIQKVGKQSLLLQQQAARNGSIFKKMSKQVYEKRNKQILINSLLQFYLAIASLLIKKQVLSLKTLQNNKQLTDNFIKIIQFVFECMDHRDNRIVSKSMKIFHQTLIWNFQKCSSQQLKQSAKTLRKKVSRKILLFIQKLTSSDQILLKQSFTILIDLFTQVSITKQFLPLIISIIKLHTNNQNQSHNIAQPYRLLKLIIYKLPHNIYDNLVYEMYQMARINVVNSNNKEIRDVCKQIALTYVRKKQGLVQAIEVGVNNMNNVNNSNSNNSNSNNNNNKNNKNNKNKLPSSQKQVQLIYLQRIKKQLNFYISNLDCKNQQNQLLILQILQQFFSNRQKPQIQQFSQLTLLSLSTSLVNGNQHISKIHQIISNILKQINKTKIYDLLQKTLIWVNQSKDKSMIRQCGYGLIGQILKSKVIKIDNIIVKKQYLLNSKKNNIITAMLLLLQEQVTILQQYLLSQRTQKKHNKLQNKQWNNILDAIQIQDHNPYINQNKILLYALDIITELLNSQQYQKQLKNKKVILYLWKMIKMPKNNIVGKCINALVKVDRLGLYLQREEQKTNNNNKQKQINNNKNKSQQNKQEQLLTFNYKTSIGTLINNNIQSSSIGQLLTKFHSQPQPFGKQTFIMSFQLLISFLNKLVMKFKIVQSHTQTIYFLLYNIVLKDQQKSTQQIYKNQQNINKLIDNLGKVSRNQFVSLECKTCNEEVINYVKEIVGVSQFYKKMAKFQSERKQRKIEQKANLARLAVTDQKAYQDIKKKKIKKEQF